MIKRINISAYIVFLAVILANPARSDEYTYRQIAVLEYGVSDNQIGLVNEPEMEPYGPRAFWATNLGHIFILDNVNEKVLVFSSSGKLLKKHDLHFWGKDMAVDDNGDMFIYDSSRRKIVHIDKNGKQQESIKVDMNRKGFFGLRIIEDDVVLITTDRKKTETTVISERFQSKTMLVKPSSDSTTPHLKSYSGKQFITYGQRQKGQAGVFILNADGKEIDAIDFPVKNVLSVGFLHEDKSGNSYFQFEARDSNARDKVRDILLSVHYLDSRGHFHSAVGNIPNNFFVWMGKMLQVDDMGNIYQVLPTLDNVQINVWERQVNGVN